MQWPVMLTIPVPAPKRVAQMPTEGKVITSAPLVGKGHILWTGVSLKRPLGDLKIRSGQEDKQL